MVEVVDPEEVVDPLLEDVDPEEDVEPEEVVDPPLEVVDPEELDDEVLEVVQRLLKEQV